MRTDIQAHSGDRDAGALVAEESRVRRAEAGAALFAAGIRRLERTRRVSSAHIRTQSPREARRITPLLKYLSAGEKAVEVARRCGAAAWRQRVHEGIRCGEVAARRDGDADLRGHLADPSTDGDERHADGRDEEPAGVREATRTGALAFTVGGRSPGASRRQAAALVDRRRVASADANGYRQARIAVRSTHSGVATAFLQKLGSEKRLRLGHAPCRAPGAFAQRRGHLRNAADAGPTAPGSP